MPTLDILQYSFWGNTIERYLFSAGIFVLFMIIAVVLNYFVVKYFEKFAKETKTEFDDTLITIFKRVIIYVLVLGGIYFGLKALLIPEDIWTLIEKITQVLLIVKVFQGITIIGDFIVRAYFRKFRKDAEGFDIQMTKLVSRILRVALWIIAISMVLQIFGYDITALVTGLGIGGLAIALAAQDTLGNFFSSLSIMADKPYKINDIIKVGPEIGIIKDIGFRTTRIDTFAGSTLSIPNSEIAKATVENLSKRKSHRYDGQIGIKYETSTAKVKEAVKIIEEILKKEKKITEDFRVFFTEFDPHSLRIEYTYYVNNPLDYKFYLNTRNEINLAIKAAYEKAKIEMAYPTQTLHLVKEK